MGKVLNFLKKYSFGAFRTGLYTNKSMVFTSVLSLILSALFYQVFFQPSLSILMRFSFKSNSTLSNRRSNHSKKVSSPLILSHKHLNYFPLMNFRLFQMESGLLMTLSATIFLSFFHFMLIYTKLILLILGIENAKLICIRIPKSKRHAEMQIKMLDLMTMREMIFFHSI